VTVEGDRGYHVGTINKAITDPHAILKITSKIHDDLEPVKGMLINKIIAENAALLRCREFCAGRRIGLYIEIIAAEFQFDRKKLTIYVKKSGDVSVCKLVRKLYDAFKMRISVEEIATIDFMKEIIANYLELSQLEIPFDEVFSYETLPNTYCPPQLKILDTMTTPEVTQTPPSASSSSSSAPAAAASNQQPKKSSNPSVPHSNQTPQPNGGVKKLTKLHLQSPALLTALHQYMVPPQTSHGSVDDMYRNHAAAAQQQKQQQQQSQQLHQNPTRQGPPNQANYPTENHHLHYQHNQGYSSSSSSSPYAGYGYEHGQQHPSVPRHRSNGPPPLFPSGNKKHIAHSSHFPYTATPMDDVRIFYPPPPPPPGGSPNGNSMAPPRDYEFHYEPHDTPLDASFSSMKISRSHPEVSRYSSSRQQQNTAAPAQQSMQPIIGTPQPVPPLLHHYPSTSTTGTFHPVPDRYRQFPPSALGQPPQHHRHGPPASQPSTPLYSPFDPDSDLSPSLSSSTTSSSSSSASASRHPHSLSFY
jgi:hypothetical protein